ncbi:hypothetical protein G6F57_023871 [Rhizopus arrhizus]|nr:hypothetical protein G6F57_023871 [Rhizopus arrhizus]
MVPSSANSMTACTRCNAATWASSSARWVAAGSVRVRCCGASAPSSARHGDQRVCSSAGACAPAVKPGMSIV